MQTKDVIDVEFTREIMTRIIDHIAERGNNPVEAMIMLQTMASIMIAGVCKGDAEKEEQVILTLASAIKDQLAKVRENREKVDDRTAAH